MSVIAPIRARLAAVALVTALAAIVAPAVRAQSTVILTPPGNGVPPSNTLVSSATWSAKWTSPDECTARLTAREHRQSFSLQDHT